MTIIKLGYLFSIGFIGFLAYIHSLLNAEDQIVLIIYYSITNALMMLFTVIDKSAAKKNKQRISELRFYVFSMLGGWFSGYVVQQWCHHKTKKQPFRFIYWGCALVHGTVVTTLYVFKFHP